MAVRLPLLRRLSSLSNCPETSLGVVSCFGSTYNFLYAAMCVWVFRFQLRSHGIVNPKQSVGSVGLFPQAIPPFFSAVRLLAPRKLSSGLEPVRVGTASPNFVCRRAPLCLLLCRGSFGWIFLKRYRARLKAALLGFFFSACLEWKQWPLAAEFGFSLSLSQMCCTGNLTLPEKTDPA